MIHWKRILIFCLATYGVTFGIGFVAGFSRAIVQRKNPDLEPLIAMAQVLLAPLSVIVAFAVLGYIQRSRTLAHIAIALAILVVMSGIVNTFLGVPITLTLVSGVMTVVMAAVGGGIGFGIGRGRAGSES